MTKNNPLACPFCGSVEVDIARTNPNACWVECANEECGATTHSHRTRTGAIKNWNRRTWAAHTTQTASIRHDDDRDRWTASQKRAAA